MLTGRAGLHFFLSSNSLPKRLLEPLPAVAWSWSLWNFQGTPRLSLLYLALFPGWMPRFFAYPCFVVVADFSSFPPILPLGNHGNILIFYPLCSLSAILPHHYLLYLFLMIITNHLSPLPLFSELISGFGGPIRRLFQTHSFASI